ncbi:MAG: hypothetical protein DRJ49_02075 [Thermoprotei archaeon]|nr:MAG: hypothetical protein DRJ49_02075 [Thermoprotei archaeon]
MLKLLYILTVVFDLISGCIAILISYYALKAYKISERKVFLLISLGFLILTSGFVGHALVLTSILLLRPVRIFIALVSTYASTVLSVSETIAYVLIAISYYTELKRRYTIAALVPSILYMGIHMFTNTVSILLLLYIILQLILIHFSEKRGSLLLPLGFTLMLIAHIMNLMAFLSLKGEFYIASRCAYFIGSLVLLYVMSTVISYHEEA